jgi:trehalose 6-phosphate synthase
MGTAFEELLGMPDLAIESPLVVASNRGPVSFHRKDDGEFESQRGSGGLVTALAGVLFEADATWVAAALTDGDREIARDNRAIEVEPVGHMRFLDVPADRYEGYYNGIANHILWFLHHHLWEVATDPVFDEGTARAWDDYREVNRAFAMALEPERDRDPVYLIQDYHLSLVPGYLREVHPTARITHFSHTPFVGPTFIRLLPDHVREALLRGMLGADVLGFQSEQWAENFLLCARDLPGARVDLRRRRVSIDGRVVLVRSYPIALDPVPLRRTGQSAEVKELRRELTEWRGDAKLLLRVDRMELSKNVPRGFMAYEKFLEDNPQWHGKVKFLALLPPSRTDITEYNAYADRSFAEAERVNTKYGTDEWQPVEIRAKEDYVGAVAAYGLYDVLLVNPVFDGMNLVAMEGPLVNRRHGTLVLSRNAGAFARLGRHAIPVNPFDLIETAEAIRFALEMPDEQKARRARGLVRAVLAHSPARWLTTQLRDVDAARGLSSEPPQQLPEPGGAIHGEVGGFPERDGGLGSEHGDLHGAET